VTVDKLGTERRRAARVELPEATAGFLEMRTRVRLLDISLTGALLGSDLPLPAGVRAQLRIGVHTGSFAPGVEIRREAGSRDHRSVHALGAAFVEMDEPSRRSLEAFLRKANQ
jgi:hypothetical protein